LAAGACGCSLLALLGHVDTVEELSVILVSDLADLGDLSADEGDVLVVDTFEDELVLEVGVELDGAAGEHLDLLGLLASEEVLDLEGLAVLGDHDVDGEVSVHESHLIFVTLRSSLLIINIKEIK
jgi:hypothetical protein